MNFLSRKNPTLYQIKTSDYLKIFVISHNHAIPDDIYKVELFNQRVDVLSVLKLLQQESQTFNNQGVNFFTLILV